MNDLTEKRQNADSSVHSIVEYVAEICSQTDFETKLPRPCNQQRNRDNIEAQNVEDYKKSDEMDLLL